jgi:SAM-dependent methyltransferase
VEDPATALVRFYDEAYSRTPAEAERYAAWRALGALGKADHVIALCERAGVRPRRTLEVGCGDGAVLSELHSRGFGGRLAGVEITDAAVAIAATRAGIEAVERYDGHRLAAADQTYDLGIVSHVLEHVEEPAELLAEVARACRVVVVEVPLEANLSARRAVKREHAAEVGHLQRLDRAAARAIVAQAGLQIGAELLCDRPPGTRPRRRQVGSALRSPPAGAAAGAAAVHGALGGAVPEAGRVAAENSIDSTRPISSSGTARGSASFWRAMPSASASIAIASCSAGSASSRSNSRTPSAISRVSTSRICAKRAATLGRTCGSRTP